MRYVPSGSSSTVWAMLLPCPQTCPVAHPWPAGSAPPCCGRSLASGAVGPYLGPPGPGGSAGPRAASLCYPRLTSGKLLNVPVPHFLYALPPARLCGAPARSRTAHPPILRVKQTLGPLLCSPMFGLGREEAFFQSIQALSWFSPSSRPYPIWSFPQIFPGLSPPLYDHHLGCFCSCT